MTLDYILKNVQYDWTVDDINYRGDIDYVSSHFGDSDINSNTLLKISDYQPADLINFINEYKKAKQIDKSITIESFYAMQEGDR